MKVLWIFFGIFAGTTFVWKFLHRKQAIVDRYEYLEILSFQEWKAGRLIKKEMEGLKGGWIDSGTFYIDLYLLEEEGLVERRLVSNISPGPDLHEFRKKIGGKRKKREETRPFFSPVFQPV